MTDETTTETTTETTVKPGWQTTEFWVSLGTALSGLLVIFGVLTPTEASTTINSITQIIGGCMTIIPTIVYAFTRAKVKQNVDINSILAILSAVGTQAAQSADTKDE